MFFAVCTLYVLRYDNNNNNKLAIPSAFERTYRIVSYRMEIRYRVNNDRCGLLPTNLTAPGGSVTSDDRHQSNNKSVVVADLDVRWLNTASEV